MKKRMQAAVNESYGGLEVIKFIDTEIPKITSNQVLVKVEAIGLNPKDILFRKGKFKRLSGNKFPQLIGFDFSGTIVESNGSEYREDEKVYGMLNGWTGRCSAEFVNVKKSELDKIPENATFEEAAGIPLAGQTALQAIRDIGQLKNGQKICINGASGGVGTLAIQIAKELGGRVTTISSSKNLELCESLGGDVCLSYAETDILNLQEKFDVFFDIFGNYSFKKTKHLLNEQGIYITTIPNLEIFKEQVWNLFRKKKGKIVIVKSKAVDLKWLSQQISQNKIKPIVDKVYDFKEIKEAQKYLETKRARGKVILKMN